MRWQDVEKIEQTEVSWLYKLLIEYNLYVSRMCLGDLVFYVASIFLILQSQQYIKNYWMKNDKTKFSK